VKKAILAKKIGMTQIFDQDNNFFGVTVLEAGPCLVTQIKNLEHDGYNAIQVGFVNTKKINKPLGGCFKKNNLEPKKFLRELKLDDIKNYKVGDEIKVDLFKTGDKIDITSISKGKGYQGAIKRHGHHRGPMAHGSKYHRSAGSMSSATTPGKVKKGKKMAGHMGARRVTVQNLEIIKIDIAKNLLIIKGSVPGARNSLVFIKNSVKV